MRRARVRICILSALIGFFVWIGPHIIGHGISLNGHGLFYFFRTAVRSGNFYMIIVGYFITGFILTLFKPLDWLFIGLSVMSLMPITAILDEIVNLSAHNLLPIELLMYALLDIPAIIGAFLARRIRLGGDNTFSKNYFDINRR